jgi:hypothetical protein
MHLFFLAPFLAFSTIKLTERHIVQLSLHPGDRRDYSFPVPNSAVVFPATSGFHALLGTGEGRVRQFAVVGGNGSVLGGFFGPKLGKLRITADTETQVVFYALVPPELSCHQIFITSDTSAFALSPHEQANASIVPGGVYCMWHISPWNLTYYFNQDGVTLQDRFAVWRLNKDPESILGNGRVTSRGGIDFFLYRGTPKVKTPRTIQRTIEIAPAPEMPVVAESLAAGGKSALIAEVGGSYKLPETSGSGNSARISFGTLFSLVLLAAALVVMIILVTVLVIAKARASTPGAAQRGARDAEETLLSRSSDWPLDPDFPEAEQADVAPGIPVVLTQGEPFLET